MAEVSFTIARRVKWAIGSLLMWPALSSALPGLLLVYGGHGSIFALPPFFQGIVGAILHAISFLVLQPSTLMSRFLALGLALVSVGGGILVAGMYANTDWWFFVEGGAIAIGMFVLLAMAPAFALSRLFAALTIVQPEATA